MKNFKMQFLQSGENGAEYPSLNLYGDIWKTFEDYINGEEGNTAKGVQRFLEQNRDAEQINVYINSMGGDVLEGTAMANQLRRFNGRVVATVDGFACSVASVIAMAADEVKMPKNAMMMIHKMYTSMTGNADELRKMADDLDVIMEGNKTIYLDKAGDQLDPDTLEEMLANETWLTAEQCLEYGFADEVLEYNVDKDEKLKQAQGNVIVQRAEDTIAQLQQAAAMLRELVAVPEQEEIEVEEPRKPRNFLELFS